MTSPALPETEAQNWVGPLTKLLGAIERNGARIIGITSDRPGSGVSQIADELRRVYASFGRAVVLVDASRLELGHEAVTGNSEGSASLLRLAQASNTGVATVDLRQLADELPSGREPFRALLTEIADAGWTVVVDLPPVARAGEPVPAFMLAGSACDSAYLVCLSGVVSPGEIKTCVEHCRINKVPLAGLVANDRHLPASQLLAS